MKGLKTFPRGGIHPHDNKKFSRYKEIKLSETPDIVTVPLSQHLGSPAEAIVAPGDKVKEGDLIAKATGFISAPVHSPVSGTVKELKKVFLANGLESDSIVIELDKEASAPEYSEQDWKNLSKEELVGIVKEKGLVGLGGATFPAYVKFSVPEDKKIDAFVVNGVECEPYLTADHRLMLEKPDEIFTGISIIKKILNPEKVYVGIEKNKEDAIKLLKEKAEKSDLDIEIIPLKMKYPQGDEKQLLKAVLGREVPSGGLPLDIGAVVANVGSVFAVYEAAVLGKSLYERILTVSGGAVKNPSNLKVKVGCTFGDLIEQCGGFKEGPAKIVSGGPMMGFNICDLDTPVTKGTSGILCLTEKEARKYQRYACISCGKCIDVCAFGMNPTRLFKLIDHQDYDQAMNESLMDCKECGCCTFTCPSGIPLVQGMRLGKKMARKRMKA